ncbi:rhodanese-like domain-containing protein [Acinetobacter gerneri]|jgi:rhodanese-related sulfurtransferase|uniref:Rhodanese-like domain-containing protein n=1 Tax=Acinetobacter gerneri TaxID=202952 RepID=A0AAW8JE81_9GAMM|nr:rhodanese-like domain-containing protein [Acinetobacter gerneri]MCH4245070.1 rhodanese-like domain-containing protein [Acinetobacter gerneri]MDQ9009794.1 rhodanese-like domain-containing protein [Acinetobacter gerneri]MDQ9013964.1 rhodanese-like domain-containing protein [Acinetobacter gerneri]MDQ9023581.1 rhodanese-like domain-containing protein [Acinetobacter gerneri]MDQ9052457.1 rhodanese-like domain-containing protein [Acinetobacter gerneri]
MNAKVGSSDQVQTLKNVEEIFNEAKQFAQQHDLNFTGSLSPKQAWKLVESTDVVLVDVRTNEERKFVGYIPESVHIAWATGTAFNRNPRFLKELENKVGKDKTILLLCRSGKRSALAAEAAFNAGFQNIYNILEGFEGDLNKNNQRNQINGWKTHQLPWVQD